MTDDSLHLLFNASTHPDAIARCAAWREAFSLSVDTVFAADEVEDFKAETRFRSFGTVLLVDTDYTAHTVSRDRRTIARTGTEQVILNMFTAGGFIGRVDGRPCVVAQGDCFLMDMSGTFRIRLHQGRFVGLIMPRSLFEKAMGHRMSMHGLVLPASGPSAELLGATLVTAARQMHALTPELAAALGPVLVNLVAACLREADGASVKPAPYKGKVEDGTGPTLAKMSRHIHRHAADPSYDTDALARTYKLSRSALYRLFQPAGGTAKAIQRRRAALALRLLQDDKLRSLASIAHASGLANERALRRALQAVYGAAPRALRKAPGPHESERPDLMIGSLFDKLLR